MVLLLLWGFLSLYHMVGFFVRVIAAARSLARSQGMLPTCFTDCRKGGSTDRDAVKRTPAPLQLPLAGGEDELVIVEANIKAAADHDGVQDIIDQLVLLAQPGS
jgi:hypothetical protein